MNIGIMIKSKCRYFIFVSALAISNSLLAQPQVGGSFDSPRPAWISTTPKDWTSMVGALLMAKDMSETYGILLEGDDQQVIDSIPAKIQELRNDLRDQFTEVCVRVDSMSASEIGIYVDEFSRYEASEYEKLFYEIVNAVSLDSANSLIQGRDILLANNRTASNIDWIKMAELEPERVKRASFCDE